MGDFYEAGIEIWTGFGLIGSTTEKRVWADYEQPFRFFFFAFSGAKKMLSSS